MAAIIDEDITKAATLPSKYYTDPAQFQVQKEKIFVRSWQWMEMDCEPGKEPFAKSWTLLPGCLDEPLLLTRDKQDRLHCLSNVCTHRGNLIIAKGDSSHKQLRCRYHGRRFGLDGKFEFMPQFEETEDFPRSTDDLPSLKLESWGPLTFTGLDPPISFSDWFKPVQERMDWLPLGDFKLDRDSIKHYEVKANWALYCDNYLEGFHIPFVHAALNAVLDYPSYSSETFDYSSLQLGMVDDQPAFTLPEGHPDEGKKIGAYYFFLFPNLMLNFYPWGLSLNLIQPTNVNATRVTFASFLWKPELRSKGAGGDLDQVELEDEQVVEQVQLGVSSRLYDRGRYSPSQEKCVHHFHRLMLQFMQ